MSPRGFGFRPPLQAWAVGGSVGGMTTRADLRKLYEGYYQESADKPDWVRVNARDKAANIRHFCAGVPHDTILDIGSGPGEVMRELAEHKFGRAFTATDITDSGLSLLRADPFPGLERAVTFDGDRLPFADGQFDLAVLSHVVEHLDNPRITIMEAARVARHVYMEVPLEYCALNRRMGRRFQLDKTGHINFYTPNLARLLVESCGLEVLRHGPRHFRPEVYSFHRPGLNGRARWFVKEAALRVAPRLACFVLNYHFGLLFKGRSSSGATA